MAYFRSELIEIEKTWLVGPTGRPRPPASGLACRGAEAAWSPCAAALPRARVVLKAPWPWSGRAAVRSRPSSHPRPHVRAPRTTAAFLHHIRWAAPCHHSHTVAVSVPTPLLTLFRLPTQVITAPELGAACSRRGHRRHAIHAAIYPSSPTTDESRHCLLQLHRWLNPAPPPHATGVAADPQCAVVFLHATRPLEPRVARARASALVMQPVRCRGAPCALGRHGRGPLALLCKQTSIVRAGPRAEFCPCGLVLFFLIFWFNSNPCKFKIVYIIDLNSKKLWNKFDWVDLDLF
jgi:hypothetical protein